MMTEVFKILIFIKVTVNIKKPAIVGISYINFMKSPFNCTRIDMKFEVFDRNFVFAD